MIHIDKANRPASAADPSAAAQQSDGWGEAAIAAFTSLDRKVRFARARLGPDTTLQRLLILLNVSLHEGLSQKELLARLDATSITALSRNLADLSAWTSRKQPGPGLLELRVDPMNLRRKTIHLTVRGRELLAALARID